METNRCGYCVPSVPVEAALWVSGSYNKKTGNVPTLWIGRTKEETRRSCAGCPLRPVKDGGNGDCYAYGTPEYALHSIREAAARDPKRYSINMALVESKRSAKMARFGALGDPGALPLEYLLKCIKKVRAVGLDAVGYTHHWRGLPELAGLFMASCDTIEEAEQALKRGWRVALTVPWNFTGEAGSGKFRLPSGKAGVVCPAVKTDGDIQCNECRLCDGSKPGPVIAFPKHGPKWSHKLRARRHKRAAEEAARRELLESMDAEA